MVIPQKTKEAEPMEQVTVLQVMNWLRIAIYNISYIRGLFPQNYFHETHIPSLGMKINKLMPMDAESEKLIAWMEKGVFDALQKKYLRTLILCICEEEEGSMIEQYEFSITYSNSNGEEIRMDLSRTGSKKNSAKFKSNAAEVNPDQMRSSACKMIRNLVLLMKNSDKMPDNEFFTSCNLVTMDCAELMLSFVYVQRMKLIYNDDITVKSVLDPCEDNSEEDSTSAKFNQDDDFSDTEVRPSEADRYVVTPDDGNFKSQSGTISKENTQDTSHEEELTAQVREWICSLDVLSSFPDTSMEMVQCNEEKDKAIHSEATNRKLLEIQKILEINMAEHDVFSNFGMLCCVSNINTTLILDSGATSHTCSTDTYMIDIKPIKKRKQTELFSADGVAITAQHEGTLNLKAINLSRVSLLPSMTMNVVSVGQLDKEGLLVSIVSGLFSIIDVKNSMLVGEGYRKDNQYIVRGLNWLKTKDEITYSAANDFQGSYKAWMVDSGATCHLTTSWRALKNRRPHVAELETAVGKMLSTYIGDLISEKITLSNVLFCPTNKHNVISVANLDKAGYRFIFYNGKCGIALKGALQECGIATKDPKNNCYYMDIDDFNVPEDAVNKRKRFCEKVKEPTLQFVKRRKSQGRS